MYEIKIPSLGESITQATLLKWHRKQGDQVSLDDLLLEIETEKVTMEVRAQAKGILESILVQADQTVQIGQVVGVINEGGSVQVQAPIAAPKIDVPQPTEIKVSPAAKKIANDENIPLDNIQGSGKGGMIMKSDVLGIKVPIQEPVQTSTEDVNKVKMSRLRKTIAQRLKDSQNTAAILTTFNEVDMSAIMELRQKHKDDFEKRYKTKLGFMSFFVKAAVASLELTPIVNAQIDGDYIVYNNNCHIGVAVGTEQGLVVPVLRNAQNLSFAEIEMTIGALSVKARENKIEMKDLSGGTFTISNGGVYGSLLSTPIINPPQSAILGMHKIQERPMVIGKEIKIRPMMYLALSYDHRLIDGKEAVTFLVKIKEFLEEPEKLLLDL
ncbi:DLST dihydrolipoamide succinyltransferase [Candidatus Phycorickettsia trachydisci]|uniref:Dihydrolipoyllysine-residue succinyltransferase component of 2-oxoglutarate dehydrogenase complex n=2 Tax=Candidatus Phycorickettsia trachydisci TaxID=2115978 RepID=A0A2P1P8C9_9RICK|nr:DLST dihydrolipoamide succinyltransferase [Candidatus Phycorickettsia trachydisci]